MFPNLEQFLVVKIKNLHQIPTQRYGGFPKTTKQFLNTNWVCYNSTWCCHCLFADRLKFHRLSVQSFKTNPLSHFRHQYKVQVVSCASNQLITDQRFSDPFLGWVSNRWASKQKKCTEEICGRAPSSLTLSWCATLTAAPAVWILICICYPVIL